MKLKVKMHPAGWIVLAVMLVYLPAGLVLAAIVSLLLHETGHVLMLKCCKIKECTVELTPFGGVADVPGYDKLPVGKKILCSAAGVAVSGMLTAASRLPFLTGRFWEIFYRCNLSVMLLNLLPVWPLDGARIASAIGERFGLERIIGKITLFMSYLFALLLFVSGIIGAVYGVVNLSLFFLPPYLCYAAYQSALYSRIRITEDLLRENPLPRGEIRAVKAFAVSGEPGKLALMRMRQTVPSKNTAIVYIVDEKTGAVSEIMTQKQICNKILTQNNAE